jgi:hypothetical protein
MIKLHKNLSEFLNYILDLSIYLRKSLITRVLVRLVVIVVSFYFFVVTLIVSFLNIGFIGFQVF